MSTTTEPNTTPEVVSAKRAIQLIKRRMKDCLNVDIYYFKVHPDELDSAHKSLDRIQGRKCMRVTYNDDHKFVVKYMPGAAYQSAIWTWTMGGLVSSLYGLIGNFTTGPCLEFMGGTTFEPSPGKRIEADSTICPMGAESPSVILEVGDSRCLQQLRVDAKIWLESTTLNVQMVVILSIDRPQPAHPNSLPKTTIEHWRAFPSIQQQKEARMVWDGDLTHGVTPGYYVRLSDLFHPSSIPSIYGAATQAVFRPSFRI